MHLSNLIPRGMSHSSLLIAPRQGAKIYPTVDIFIITVVREYPPGLYLQLHVCVLVILSFLLLHCSPHPTVLGGPQARDHRTLWPECAEAEAQ